jgi:hypothetical protein
MAVTNTLNRILGVAQIYIRQAPLIFPDLAAPNDLVLLAGDWVRQFMLSPPFAWRWNRLVSTFPTVAGVQDYAITIPTFGWLETASIIDNNVSPSVGTQLVIKLSLGEDVVQNQPVSIAARLDNNAGLITFRLLPVPDKIYTVTVTSQNAAPSFVNLADTWTPIPDYLSYVYQQGFLAKAYEYFADERFSEAIQLFIKQTIAANAGLTDTQVNLFMAERIDTQRQELNNQQKTQLGNQARYLG